jgi:hypothetical protein
MLKAKEDMQMTVRSSVRFFCAVILFLMAAMLSGCIRHEQTATQPSVRVVTEVTVEQLQTDDPIFRRYTAEESIGKMLNYLRLLRPWSMPGLDPEPLEGDVYRIIVHYSDGHQTVYHQKSDSYLSIDLHTWQRIDPDVGDRLEALLEDMPSDLTAAVS